MSTPINRRDAVKAASLLVGGAMVMSTGLLAGCGRDRATPAGASTLVLGESDQRLIDAIADTILPTTAASPGAKAAGAGAAINLLLSDCYDADAQQRVLAGLAALRERCARSCKAAFADMPQAPRETLLREIDADAVKAGDSHWFHLVRELSLRAYFSSEVGMTQALRYVMVPGRWTGCVPLTPGQPAWG